MPLKTNFEKMADSDEYRSGVCAIVNNSPIPQFVIDKNHKVICWNRALENCSGRKASEIIGTDRHWQAFYGQKRPCLADLLIDGKIKSIPEFYKGKYQKSSLMEGAYEAVDFFPAMGSGGKWFYFTAAPIKDANGLIIGSVETLEDITEQKNTKDVVKNHNCGMQKNCEAFSSAINELALEKTRLAEMNAKDEAVLMSIGEGLLITDKNGKITFVNKIFENLIGFRAHEVIGMPMVEAILCEDDKGNLVEPPDRLVSQILAGSKAANGIAYYVRKNKTRFPVGITVTPIISGQNLMGAVEVFRDITREKEIDNAKSEFIYLASHQLRNAPTAINWAAESLLSQELGPINDEQRKYLQEIYQRNKNATGLINDLLNVSKIELGRFVVDPEPVEITKVCKDIIREFEPQITEKKLIFKEIYDRNLSIIQVDRQLIQIVLQNLIFNAIQYTPAGGRVTVKTAWADEVPNVGKTLKNVLISITDTGCGIPQNQYADVFFRMFRAENAKSIQPNGSGLGLYIAKSILAQTGGKIWFSSQLGKGSIFYVALPASGMKERVGDVKLARKPQ